MMKKLDQRGTSALELCLVAPPLFLLMFTIIDLGRYAITYQSLRTLANAGAREIMLSYDPISKTYTGCTGDLLPAVATKNLVPPFLTGLSLTLVAGGLTVTASTSNYHMLYFRMSPPSASTSIPFCGP
jgi:Flp pilus assembly protein TadG